MERVFLLLLPFCLHFASSELPDEYDVRPIRQTTACPTIYCPWNCERFIDPNGCLFCGRCSPKTSCPAIKCPNLPHFGCVARVGRDGCTTCKCKAKLKPVCPGPVPMCSMGCSLQKDGNGCMRCSCPPNPPLHCTEAADAPCKRSDCFRERGADGCYHCICPDDVYSCPEIRCDPKKKCIHIVDQQTGCATGCQCEVENNESNMKPAKVFNGRPIPLAQHPGIIKTPLRG